MNDSCHNNKKLLKTIDAYLTEKKIELDTITSLLDQDLLNCYSLAPSTILTYRYKKNLEKLCNFTNKTKWEMLYRASKDGFTAKNFHQKCDGSNNTLTIIKSTEGYIFGGYTEATWTSNNSYSHDKNSFLFSLINKMNTPLVLPCANPEFAIYCGSHYGPTFGYSTSLFISDSSNLNPSYSDLSYNYKHPMYESNRSLEARYLLTGSEKFLVKDIEVFQQI